MAGVVDKEIGRELDRLRLGSMSEDIVKGEESFEHVLAATSMLNQKGMEIRSQRVNWQSYQQSQMISDDDYNFIIAFEGATGDQKDSVLKHHRTQCAKTFLGMLGHISKDKTVQYVLILIDDMLNEDKSRVEIFQEYSRKRKDSVWSAFLSLLNRNDSFIQNISARIIAKIACWSPDLMDGPDLTFYLTWLKDQLRIQGNEYLQAVARCLQMMLRIDEYRMAFVSMEGISTIIYVLGTKVNFQIQYQLIFCLWILTFNPVLAENVSKYNVIPVLADILADSVKEKVTRIILATFKNLIKKPEDPAIAKEHAITMVHRKVLKQLEMLQQSGQKFEDPDMLEDMEFLTTTLQASVVDMSSFDEYATEVKSGRLEWSPVHSSEKFWRENAVRLNEKNYELLKVLVRLLESSKDALVLSVAAHDLGEYVRHYSRGKVVCENLGGKHLVMQMLTHEDPNVRYEALLCVQKLMVTHWEYLGRQLQQDTKKGSTIAVKS